MKLNIKRNDKLLMIIIMTSFVLFLFAIEQYNLQDKNTNKNNNIRKNSLIITEIMSFNEGIHADKNGNLYDWIELYNGTDKDIDLRNYGLSDDSNKVKCMFQEKIIKAKEYLVIYLAGKDNNEGYCTFALKKEGGEKVLLRNSSSRIIDSVKTLSLDKNTSMSRNENGLWEKTSEITPGFANVQEGRKEYLNSQKQDASAIRITEILPNNRGIYMLNGKLPKYIEVTNYSNSNVDLSEYYLSTDKNTPYLWKLPNQVLKPNEVYLVYPEEISVANKSILSLKKKVGTVVLSHKNQIVDEIKYDISSNGLAYVKIGNEFFESNDITPGYINDINGSKSFANQNKKSSGLIINEIMSSNDKYLSQNGGEFYDWIEIYNNSNKEIDLSEYYLSTDKDSKKMYQLPQVKLKEKSYYILMASGDIKLSNKSYQHTNFKLSSAEGIFLYHDSKLIDSMFIYNIPVGYSYGKGEEYGHYYYSSPTPKSKNQKNGVLAISYDPTFSDMAGVYNNIKELKITLNSKGTIYYTLDGSIPTKKSKVYNGPITLKKTSVIRAVSYENGKKESNIITNSYIINENHSSPVVSVSLPESSFNILNSYSYNQNAYKAHAELFEDGKKFSADCGIKLFGGESRTYNKKSYSLKFTSQYGTSGLEYKVFDNRDAVKYKTLVLRSGSQDMKKTIFRDELITSIVDDYGTVDVQASKPVVLYINGKYWGIYFLREKINEEFINNHYNVSEKGANIYRIDYETISGNASALKNMIKYSINNNLANDKNYEYIEKKLDIDNYIDLWITEIFSGDSDMVNIRFFNHPDIDNNKVKTIAYDFDYSYAIYIPNYFSWMTIPGGVGYYKLDNTLLINLFKNKKFKKRFIERLSYNLNNVWTDENIMKSYNEFYNVIKLEIKRDRKRWGLNYNDWEYYSTELKNKLKNRRKEIINQAKDYFGLTKEEVNKYFT